MMIILTLIQCHLTTSHHSRAVLHDLVNTISNSQLSLSVQPDPAGSNTTGPVLMTAERLAKSG